MHVDLNAFFATAEELRDPSLVGKPLIVGGAGRAGIVSTANYEARKYGIHSAMPTFQAQRLCPGLIIKHPDFDYYEMLSASFFAYIKRYTALVEPASIDECYADMTKAMQGVKDPVGYLEAIQKGLLSEIGLKCSIGLGPTKWLAKMASDMKKPMGITILRRRDMRKKLYPLPIESFWGIGRKSAPKLREMGIATIGDLADRCGRDDPEIMEFFGKGYETIKAWCEGRGSDEIELESPDPKSIGHATTLGHDTNDDEEIVSVIRALSMRVASGARSEGMKGRTVQLQVKDTSFKVHDKSVSFKEPTDDWREIASKAEALYRKSFLGMLVRQVGVTLQNLVNPRDETVQMSLWNYEEYEEMDKTKLLINDLNRKMRKDVLKRGSDIKKDGTE
jgi:DNA polymerase-4